MSSEAGNGNNEQQGGREPLKGVRQAWVVSDKRDKTRRVVATDLQKVRKYEKYVRKRSVFHVHDPNNESKTGDFVEIAECRPISKTKSWRLVRVVEAAPGGTQTAAAEPAAGGESS